MTEQIKPELVERMVAQWRCMAGVEPEDVGAHFASNWISTARAIVAELPVPIDPNLLLAREVARDWIAPLKADAFAHDSVADIALAAIKRVRAGA